MKFEISIRQWYSQNKRILPWRETKNPYLVWLSEVIMQQTRIAQGTRYYQDFARIYPTVNALANASVDDVLKLWEGLGYYSRARNLHAAAKQIVAEFNGEIPNNYINLLKIKGIGPYTAAAISSICFNEKRAVVDGNVYRVLSRIYGIKTPINSTLGVKLFADLANKLIAQSNNPGEYNEAVMEFGALQCTPKNPDCGECIFNTSCIAFTTGSVADLPVKTKPNPLKNRYLNYTIYIDGDKIALQKRATKDIWQGLYEFPLIETETTLSSPKKAQLMCAPVTHILSHQRLHISFWLAKNPTPLINSEVLWHKIAELEQLAFPIVLKRFINTNLLHLRHR